MNIQIISFFAIYIGEGINETQKGGIKRTQETLTDMMPGFKALRRKTKLDRAQIDQKMSLEESRPYQPHIIQLKF